MLFNIFFHFFSANSPMPKALNTTRESIKLPNKKQLGTNSTASYKTKGARYYRHSSFKTLSTPSKSWQIMTLNLKPNSRHCSSMQRRHKPSIRPMENSSMKDRKSTRLNSSH